MRVITWARVRRKIRFIGAAKSSVNSRSFKGEIISSTYSPRKLADFTKTIIRRKSFNKGRISYCVCIRKVKKTEYSRILLTICYVNFVYEILYNRILFTKENLYRKIKNNVVDRITVKRRAKNRLHVKIKR